jgi:hypothetical protein
LGIGKCKTYPFIWKQSDNNENATK